MPEQKQQKQVTLNEQQLMQLFQTENERLNESNQKGTALRNILTETMTARDTISGITGAKKDEKIMVPIGAGILIAAKIEDNKTALWSMQGSAAVKKPFEEIEKELATRIQNIELALEKEMHANQAVAQNLNNLGMVIRQAENAAKQRRK